MTSGTKGYTVKIVFSLRFQLLSVSVVSAKRQTLLT